MAYVDHPSFGTAVVGRLVEREGFRVAILPQPTGATICAIQEAGPAAAVLRRDRRCMDSMINRYTASKRLRSDDAYTPDGAAGFRPDYAVTVTRASSSSFTRRAGGARRHRGEPAARHALRLLVRHDQTHDPRRKRAESARLWHGRAAARGNAAALQRGVPFASLKTIAQTAVLLPPGAAVPKNQRWRISPCTRTRRACKTGRAMRRISNRSKPESTGCAARRCCRPWAAALWW